MFFVRNNCTCVYMLLVFIYSASDVQKCFLVLLLVHRHDKHYCSTWIFPAWMASIENPNISMYCLLRYQPNWKGLHVQSMMLICDIILPLHSSIWGSVVTNLLQGAASGLDTAQAPCSINAVASLLLWNFFRASITYYYLDFYFRCKKT